MATRIARATRLKLRRGAGVIERAYARPVQDLDAARRQVKGLAGSTDIKCWFQTFDDSKQRRDHLARTFYGTVDERWAELIALQAQGAGAFITVSETSAKGRKGEHFVRGRAIWHDDDTKRDGPLAMPIEPHLVIESSPGKHHQYFLGSTTSAKALVAVEKAMAEGFGHDKNACDCTRVMRLAGTLHLKNPDEPFLVRIISENPDLPPYEWSAIGGAFSVPAREAAKQPRKDGKRGKVVEGGRHHALLSKAGKLRNETVPLEQALALVLEMNSKECVPPQSEQEVQALVEDVYRRYAPGEYEEAAEGVSPEEFYAFMPTHMYYRSATGDMWPAASVNSQLGRIEGKRPSAWLDHNRAAQQMSWCPGQPELIKDMLVAHGGLVASPGNNVLNTYKPPVLVSGDAANVRMWLDHLKCIYPAEWLHIVRWLAHRTQRPGEKINHALVLGGSPGIGKDAMLHPVVQAVGPWNANDIAPWHLLAQFNEYARAVILRINEAHDLGDTNRYAVHEASKVLIAAPPDTLRVNAKHMREFALPNVVGVIYTTNHRTDSLHLPPDDRRHYVAWSPVTVEQLPPDYFQKLFAYYEAGGVGHVAAYLRTLDLSDFDPKAPPPKTEAFWAIVDANRAPEDAELADALDRLSDARGLKGKPVPAITLEDVVAGVAQGSFRDYLLDRKNRRQLPHRFEAAGYVAVRNQADLRDGQWRIAGRRQTVYALRTLTVRDQCAAAQKLVDAARTLQLGRMPAPESATTAGRRW